MKTKTAALFLLFSVLLCSCTVQTDFDVYDFCKRYNSLTEEKTLSSDSFLSDNDGGLYCFMTVGESRLLVTLETDENTAVRALFVTAHRDEYAAADRESIIKTVGLLFASFACCEGEKADSFLALAGFDGDFEPFSASYGEGSADGYGFTLYSDMVSFTVCAEKIDYD